MPSSRLVLTDDSLRVAVALLPCSPICGELLRARDSRARATLGTDEVRQLSRALNVASSETPVSLLVRAALHNGAEELRAALRRVDVDALDALGCHTVSVVMVEPSAAAVSVARAER